MHAIWYFVYFLAFLSITFGAICFRSYQETRSLAFPVMPSYLLPAAFCLYSSSLPLSRMMNPDVGQESDMILLRLHLFGAIGFAAAQSFMSALVARRTKHNPTARVVAAEAGLSLRQGLTFGITLVCFAFFVDALLGRLNYNVANILKPYGFEDAENYIDSGLGSTLAYFGFYTGVFLLVYWNRWVEPVNRRIMSIVYGLIVINLLLWLMRGSRNMFILMLLPLVAIVLYRQKIKLIRYASIGFVGLVGMYLLGSLRNVGFENIAASDVREIASSLDIYQGELATSYSVLDKALNAGLDMTREYGYTYTVGVAINLIPRAIWPSRPDNIAVEFSKRYFNTNNLSEGLGFSPVAEAMINFGEFGIIGVFFVFLVFIVLIEGWLVKSVMLGQVALACAVPMVFNWNRIDLATVLKMYSGYVLMLFCFRMMCIRRSARGSHFPRRGLLGPIPAADKAVDHLPRARPRSERTTRLIWDSKAVGAGKCRGTTSEISARQD